MRNEATACSWPWRRWALAALLLALGLAAGPAHAADMYRVMGVPVDATAESAVAAREQAIAEGEREGLRRLLRRLTAPADHARLPRVEDLPLDRFVNSYEIASERVGPTQYIATLNISYLAEETQELLRGQGLSFVTRRSEPILVVPVEETASGPVAWLETSTWRAAWYDALEQATVTVLTMPLADLADVADAPPTALLSGDQSALDALGARYGAAEVIVAIARLERDQDGKLERVAVTARPSDDWSRPILRQVVEPAAGEEEPATLARAVGLVVAAIEDDWKRRTLVPLDALSTVVAAVPLAGLSGWVQVRNELASLREVRSLRLESFSRAGARVAIGYEGEFPELLTALEGVGLTLAQEVDGWHLRPATGPEEPLAPPPALPAPQ